MKYIFKVIPIGKPRMTQSDKWNDRKPVLQYFAFKDEIRVKARTLGFSPSEQMRIWFYLPMPKSWSQKKRLEMKGEPHKQKPDRDNLEKAFLDALFEQDCVSWHGETFKYWDIEGRIEVEHIV